MFRKLFDLKKRGSVLMMTALASVFLVGMTSLVTDVGYMYYNQSRLQTATNAGWKAGYDRMMMLKADDGVLDAEEKTQVISHIKEVMQKNGLTSEQLQELEVDFEANNQLEVKAKVKVGLFFARVMDFNYANVAAGRKNHDDDTGQGIIPLSVPHGVVRDVSKNVYTWDKFEDGQEFRPDEEYILKLGDGDVVQSGDIMPMGLEANDPDDKFFGYVVGEEYSLKSSPGDDTSGLPYRGNFGALNLNPSHSHGGGAKGYENNIVYGYNYEVETGEQYYPETGNMAGPTIDGIDYRMENGLTNVLIPVVSDYGSGASSQVTILGFLNFTLVGTGLEGNGNNTKATVRAIFNGYSDEDLGKKKHNYGIIDPDNERGGNPNDYENRLKHGFNGVADINNRLIPEAENKAEPTDEAVDFRVNNSNRRVIIPITQVDDNIGDINPINEGAETIYDLQDLENPNGAYTTDEYTFGSSPTVTGFAEFEILDPSKYNRKGDNYETGDNGDLGPYQPGQVRGKFIRYIVKPGEVPVD